jgi:hypothetical protein
MSPTQTSESIIRNDDVFIFITRERWEDFPARQTNSPQSKIAALNLIKGSALFSRGVSLTKTYLKERSKLLAKLADTTAVNTRRADFMNELKSRNGLPLFQVDARSGE